MNNLEEFKKRNKRRNKRLYTDGAIEGIHYRVCPVSNARLKSIGNRYVTETLGMTLEEYDEKHPGVRKSPQTKLEKFKTRNRTRNKELYGDGKIKGKDYVICPASGERLSMIKSSYITKILDMTVDEYDKKYPGVRGVCEKRVNNIKRGLKKVDYETGLTKHELSCVKAKESLLSVGDDGLTGYERKGKKTKETHMNKVDKDGRNGYQRIAHYRKTTICDNGLTVEQNAHIKQTKKLINLYGGIGGGSHSSIQSTKLNKIVNILDQLNYKYYYQESEFCVFDEKLNTHYLYDLVCPKLKLVVEFQGSGWHPNPFTLSDKEWKNWTNPVKDMNAVEKNSYDYNKAKVIYDLRKYVTFFVYHDTADSDISLVEEYINAIA